ncbi:hypothetical protein [Acinetobacter junii]|uniref:hypothetical protein n=1 Tax=Acinetobacter junii TaxID=40215 RepID=UPI001F3AE376|nr:hypothetical protein [Acinetobacter junii]MDR0079180.1 hypothetical protein [Acinetobacter baumannii]
MKDINYLNPIYRHFSKNRLIMGGRFHLKKYLIIRLLEQQLPELKFNIELDFPFNPKHIPKVPQRHVRKACYQSFALYKKSYKPNRLPRFRIIKDELQWFKKDEPLQGFDDCSRWITEEFHCQFLQLPDPEPLEFGQFIPKGIIHRDI